MGRWTQYDEDSYRLPEGMVRTGYDADTGQYYFRDRSGTAYAGAPGSQYGVMKPVSSVPPLPLHDLEATTPNKKKRRSALTGVPSSALRSLRRSLTTTRSPWRRSSDSGTSSDDEEPVLVSRPSSAASDLRAPSPGPGTQSAPKPSESGAKPEPTPATAAPAPPAKSPTPTPKPSDSKPAEGSLDVPPSHSKAAHVKSPSAGVVNASKPSKNTSNASPSVPAKSASAHVKAASIGVIAESTPAKKDVAADAPPALPPKSAHGKSASVDTRTLPRTPIRLRRATSEATSSPFKYSSFGRRTRPSTTVTTPATQITFRTPIFDALNTVLKTPERAAAAAPTPDQPAAKESASGGTNTHTSKRRASDVPAVGTGVGSETTSPPSSRSAQLARAQSVSTARRRSEDSPFFRSKS